MTSQLRPPASRVGGASCPLTCVQLLKGVGTKCWAPDAEYALHSVYQGGLFELRAGDELFVSVSSPTMVNADDSSSYFGAFRLDL